MKNISCLKRISEFLKILSEMMDEEIGGKHNGNED